MPFLSFFFVCLSIRLLLIWLCSDDSHDELFILSRFCCCCCCLFVLKLVVLFQSQCFLFQHFVDLVLHYAYGRDSTKRESFLQ